MVDDENGQDRSRPAVFRLQEWQCIVARLGLTPQQAQVVGYLIQGFEDRETAAALGVRPKTVRDHRQAVKSRLKVRNRMEIVYQVLVVFRSECEGGM